MVFTDSMLSISVFFSQCITIKNSHSTQLKIQLHISGYLKSIDSFSDMLTCHVLHFSAEDESIDSKCSEIYISILNCVSN